MGGGGVKVTPDIHRVVVSPKWTGNKLEKESEKLVSKFKDKMAS